VWRVDGRYRLWSALHDELWEPRRPLVAACGDGHTAPDEHCRCGIYAARQPELAQPYLVGRNSPEAVHRVLGRVALWGSVVECAHGWRAERAYPLRLWVPDDPFAFEIAFELGRYGVPVELVRSRSTGAVVEAASAA
jgi:hypothetical protein